MQPKREYKYTVLKAVLFALLVGTVADIATFFFFMQYAHGAEGALHIRVYSGEPQRIYDVCKLLNPDYTAPFDLTKPVSCVSFTRTPPQCDIYIPVGSPASLLETEKNLCYHMQFESGRVDQRRT